MMGSSSSPYYPSSSTDVDNEDVDNARHHLLLEQVEELKRQLGEVRLENQELRARLLLQQQEEVATTTAMTTTTSSTCSYGSSSCRPEAAAADAAALNSEQPQHDDDEEGNGGALLHDQHGRGEQAAATTTTTTPNASLPSSSESMPPTSPYPSYVSTLSSDQIERYSRQVLAGLGVQGQQKLLKAKVVVVGAGGIGSSCLLYLAGCGIGHLTVVDNDQVEVSNLHRQIIHTTTRCGLSKAQSARRAVLALNPTIECVAVQATLTHDNAMELFSDCDIIVDASDNPRTRYLINDAAILLARQNRRRTVDDVSVSVVFASAVATEAQITVFTHRGSDADDDHHKNDECCYRCLYPDPGGSVASNCASCSDAGVLGTVPGLVGVLQATQVIQLLTDTGNPWTSHVLHYDANESRFMKVRKPPRRRDCAVCGSTSSKPILSMLDSWESLQNVRGPAGTSLACPAPLPTSTGAAGVVHHMSPLEYYSVWRQPHEDGSSAPPPFVPVVPPHHHLLLDVRDEIQYELCHLPGSVNVPLRILANEVDRVLEMARGRGCAGQPSEQIARIGSHTEEVATGSTSVFRIYCLCRRGIASAKAADLLLVAAAAASTAAASTAAASTAAAEGTTAIPSNVQRPTIEIWNVRGGLDAWRTQVDPNFPTY